MQFRSSCPTVLVPILLSNGLLENLYCTAYKICARSAVTVWCSCHGLVSKGLIVFKRYMYKHSRYSYSDFEDMKMIDRAHPRKDHTIVNWFDDRELREVSWAENRFIKKYGLRTISPMQYAGTMGYVFTMRWL